MGHPTIFLFVSREQAIKFEGLLTVGAINPSFQGLITLGFLNRVPWFHSRLTLMVWTVKVLPVYKDFWRSFCSQTFVNGISALLQNHRAFPRCDWLSTGGH